MPELKAEQRAAGGYATDKAPADQDRDWSIPTDLETLRRRPAPEAPDQKKYGRATDG